MQVSDDDRIFEVLEGWFQALDAREVPNLSRLCDGDATLMATVSTILRNDPLGRSATVPDSTPPEEGTETAAVPEGFGEFRIVSLIGSGGMGQVYLARQEGLDRPVALKIVAPEILANDPRARRRLRHEATIAAGLDHPNIVPIYSVGEEGEHAYVAMKWLTGPGLDDLQTPATPELVATWGAAIARALEEAHQSGVLHRDLKPANIILDGETPFLVDFGLAVSRTRALGLSRSGSITGTLPYMPPEQLQGRTTLLDGRADVYSLGATLYELLAGTPPFGRGDTEDVVHGILFRDPPALRLERAHRDLESIIMRALEKRPDARYASGREMAEDLERYLAGEATVARPLGAIVRAGRVAKRHPRASAAVGVALLTAAIAVGAFVRSTRREAVRREDGVRIAWAALDDGRPSDALQRIADLRRSWPGARGLDALETAFEAEEALEELLDRIVLRPGHQSTAELVKMIGRVESSVAPQRHPETAGLALAVALHYLQEKDRARAWLASTPVLRERRTRAAAAVGALLDEVAIPREIPARSPRDHFMTFLALRASGGDLAEQHEEIDAARASAEYRYRLAYAVHLGDGADPAPALAALRSLGPASWPSDVLRLAELRLELRARNFGRVLAELRTRPEETLRPHEWAMLLRALEGCGRGEELARAVAVLGGRPEARDPDVRLILAHWEARQGHRSAAVSQLETVAKEASIRSQRERAAAALLVLRFQAVQEDQADAGTLRADAEALAATAALPAARQQATFVGAALRARDGGGEGARDLLRDALKNLDGEARLAALHLEPQVLLLFARRVALDLGPTRRGERKEEPLSDRDEQDLERARQGLCRALATGPGDEAPLTDRQRLMAWVLSVQLAHVDEDLPAARAAITEALRLGDTAGWPDAESDRAVRQYARFYGIESY